VGENVPRRSDAASLRGAKGSARRAVLEALGAQLAPAFATGPVSPEDRVRILLQSQVTWSAPTHKR
jgi:hypothetical protein